MLIGASLLPLRVELEKVNPELDRVKTLATLKTGITIQVAEGTPLSLCFHPTRIKLR